MSVDQTASAGGTLEALKPNNQVVEAEAYGLWSRWEDFTSRIPRRWAARRHLFSRTLMSISIMPHCVLRTVPGAKIRVPIPIGV